MPTWAGHLISGAIGALVYAFGAYIILFGRVKDMEYKHEMLRSDFESEKRRAAKEVLETARETIRLVNTLVLELQAERRANE